MLSLLSQLQEMRSRPLNKNSDSYLEALGKPVGLFRRRRTRKNGFFGKSSRVYTMRGKESVALYAGVRLRRARESDHPAIPVGKSTLVTHL